MRATSSTESWSASGPRWASSACAASGRSSQTPARFFEPASVSCSSPPSTKRSLKIGDLAPLPPGGDVLQPAGAHQVHEQHELVVVGRQQEPLRPPLDAAQALALERLQRRVERLQRCDVRGAGLLDRRPLHERVELAAPRLDLR